MQKTPSIEEVFSVDDTLDDVWRIESTHSDARRVLIRAVRLGTSERVEFALWSASEASRPGPLDVGAQRISYQVSAVPFERFRAAGKAVGERLRRADGDDPARLVQHWIAEGARAPRRLPVLRDDDASGERGRDEHAQPETLLPQAETRPAVEQQTRDGVVAVLTSPSATAAAAAAAVERARRAGAREVVLRGTASMCAGALAELGKPDI